MAYAAVSDLLLGDLIVAESIDRQKFVDLAAEEMNSKLGWVYELPLRGAGSAPSATSWLELPAHEVSILKTINNRLASGRLILSLYIAGEDSQLHAYGYQLVQEAMSDLMLIANGNVSLSAHRTSAYSREGDTIPGISQHDDESLLLGFENSVMRGKPWYTIPGQVP